MKFSAFSCINSTYLAGAAATQRNGLRGSFSAIKRGNWLPVNSKNCNDSNNFNGANRTVRCTSRSSNKRQRLLFTPERGEKASSARDVPAENLRQTKFLNPALDSSENGVFFCLLGSTIPLEGSKEVNLKNILGFDYLCKPFKFLVTQIFSYSIITKIPFDTFTRFFLNWKLPKRWI